MLLSEGTGGDNILVPAVTGRIDKENLHYLVGMSIAMSTPLLAH
jgi:hypothetical protein